MEWVEDDRIEEIEWKEKFAEGQEGKRKREEIAEINRREGGS